jgi:hypothetical protein
MRNEDKKGVTLRFVQARSRLKPIKAAHTFPHMELMAMELGLALAKKLLATLSVQHKDIFLCTDSREVHDWLRVESRALQVFVKNRVLKVRQYLRLEQILWVPGVINPADAATRGLTVVKLMETESWTQGPEILKRSEETWPEQPPEPGQDLANILPDTITGLKKTKENLNKLLFLSTKDVSLFTAVPAKDDFYQPEIPTLQKYSEWTKLIVNVFVSKQNKKEYSLH